MADGNWNQGRNQRNRLQRFIIVAKQLLFIVCLFFVFIAGCDNFSLYTELDGISEGPFAISPRDISLPDSAQYTFSASGGFPPYSYSIFQGSGSIDESTGVYTAPGLYGYDIVRVTDLSGNTSDSIVEIYVAGATLIIIPDSITIAKGESCTFSAIGGTPPYIYSVFFGTGTINSSTGFFTAPDKVETDTVRVIDSVFSTADATVKIRPK